MCIESARKALSMGSRHRGLVHKCLYLSHIALGESLAAVQALEQGILKALDNGDRAELYGIFQEFTNRQPPFDPCGLSDSAFCRRRRRRLQSRRRHLAPRNRAQGMVVQ